MTVRVSQRGLLLAAVSACSSANLYYNQPVLASIGRSIHATPAAAATVVVATLIGNALAQLLIVPLADLVERRRLAQSLLCVQAVGMVLTAVAPTLIMATCASVIVGLGGASAMVVLPYAASLAEEKRRGHATGQVMSGVLFGILFSRSLSGFISTASSWRLVYALGGGATVYAAALISRLPRSFPEQRPSGYRELLASTAHLVVTDRALQRRMFVGALGFLSFNVLWTGLTLLLAGGRYHYSDLSIGLFGLIGLLGAVMAKNAGQWHDSGRGSLVSAMGWLLIGGAWLISLVNPCGGMLGITAVVLTVAFLDVGMQAQHITNQASLLASRPEQSGRVTTAYMSICVLAGAIGSALASSLFPRFGWISLSGVGLGSSVLALLALTRVNRD